MRQVGSGPFEPKTGRIFGPDMAGLKARGLKKRKDGNGRQTMQWETINRNPLTRIASKWKN